MDEIIRIALSFPTAIFSALVGLVVFYWLLVLVGGADPDALDPHADVHADVHADAHADVHADAHADHGDHGDAVHGGSGWLSGLLTFLNVGSVPVTLIASFAIIQAWAACMLLELYARQPLAALVPAALLGALFFCLSLGASTVLASLTTKPLRGLFKVHSVHEHDALVDSICTVQTTEVTADFGQACVERKGSPLLLDVRCPGKNGLTKGKEAVIVSFDKATNTYEIGELYPENDSRRAQAGEPDAPDGKRNSESKKRTRTQ